MAIFKIDIPGLYGEVTHDDLVFLSKVKVKILENIPDPLFGGPELATRLGLSPAQLSRRLKSLTSYSPSRMIKYFRMEYAMVLVRETHLPLKEVTVNTGFMEQGNFARTFKNHFGQSATAVRTQLQDRSRSLLYQCGTPLSTGDIKYFSWLCNENDWFARVLSLTLRHVHQEDFSPTRLSAMLSLSTGQFNRKLKGLLSISAGRFIKNIRLHYAAELLHHTNEPIGEIAYKSGFFDHPHFCRVFREAYRHSPKDFRNTYSNEKTVQFLSTSFN